VNSESSLRRIVSTVRWLSPFGILCKRPNEALLKRWLELFRFLSCIDMTLFDGDFLMPLIHFAGETIGCSRADNLRSVLMRQEPSMRGKLYNDAAGLLHCRGLGTCGTCAVEVQGELTPATKVERWRLGFPPHQSDSGLRLACQVCVMGDLIVTKHAGMWGHRLDD
jgi:hypothetical protein